MIERVVGRSYEHSPDPFITIHLVHSDMPPCLLIRAGNEYMFPRVQHESFAAAITAAGVPCQFIVYPDAEHGFTYDVRRPCPQKAFTDMLAFLDRCEIGEPS